MWIKCDKNIINSDHVKMIDAFGRTVRLMSNLAPKPDGTNHFDTCLGTILCESDIIAEQKVVELLKQLNP